MGGLLNLISCAIWFTAGALWRGGPFYPRRKGGES